MADHHGSPSRHSLRPWPYTDAFRATLLALIVAILLVPVLRQVAPPERPPRAAH
jgi:hypothetical protein